MTNNSTTKMLASMVKHKKAKASDAQNDTVTDPEQQELSPELKPQDMEHVLSNILGQSFSKKNTPMD